MALSVDIAGLQSAANDLEQQRQAIYDTYTQSVKKVLESSDQCFHVAGIDTTSIITNFDKIYTNFNDNATILIRALNTTITNYSDLQGILTQQFNGTFANQLSELIPGIVFYKK